MYNKSNPETIQNMFSSIARDYDRANAIMSFRFHRRWNRQLVDAVVAHAPTGTLLDLCCGTGEIAFDYLRRQKTPQKVYMLDFCKEMLEQAKIKEKALPLPGHFIQYLNADAQAIPLAPSTISLATIAYGIRNVKNPFICICDVHRVLKPGGVLGILELTQPQNPLLKMGHSVYLKTLLPAMGWAIASNKAAYDYLQQSIKNFTKPSQLENMMLDAGFAQTRRIPLLGGVATILLAKK